MSMSLGIRPSKKRMPKDSCWRIESLMKPKGILTYFERKRCERGTRFGTCGGAVGYGPAHIVNMVCPDAGPILGIRLIEPLATIVKWDRLSACPLNSKSPSNRCSQHRYWCSRSPNTTVSMLISRA
ncbi:protein of unknown function [Nitrospira japonica]|uniref:Uncharacterized protein n=1 Tax=Nitrospira japonica TaxID=1325564 RepID=A0A1W1I9I3_9BACT|nr:protein of unknown function [Nitrospira japonica]